jgi:predicted nucleic acid-binding Zn ribbon protein
MSSSKRHSVPPVITIEPGPWRRRKRLVIPVLLANLSDALLLAAFIGMTVYSCWAFQNPTEVAPSHTRLRQGNQLPARTLDNTP